MHWLLNHRTTCFRKKSSSLVLPSSSLGSRLKITKWMHTRRLQLRKLNFHTNIQRSMLCSEHFFWQAAECCQEKTVGGVSYSLLPEAFHGSLPHQCLTSCVYTKTGILSSPKFCFARGFANSLYMCVLSAVRHMFGHIICMGDFSYPQMFFCTPKRFLQPFWFVVSPGDLATECLDTGFH